MVVETKARSQVELISASLFSESLWWRKFRKDSPQRHRLHSKTVRLVLWVRLVLFVLLAHSWRPLLPHHRDL